MFEVINNSEGFSRAFWGINDAQALCVQKYIMEKGVKNVC
jgi:hypothetical protein